MTTYSELVKRFREQNSKPKTSWKYVSWLGDTLNIPAHLQHQFEGGQLPTEEFYQYQSIPQSERPLTGAEGGRVAYQSGQLVDHGPGRPGYAGNTWIEEGIYQMPNKKYKIEIKRKSGNLFRTVDKLEDAKKLKFDFLKTSTKEVPMKGVVRTKLPMAELKKAAKHFFDIGDFTTSNYKDLTYEEMQKVQQRVQQGEGKFKKKTVFDPLSKTNQEKILRYFPDAVFTKDQKWGFPPKSKKGYNVQDFAQRGYKWKHSILPESVQKDLVTKFGKEVKDWDFKNNQYGAKPGEVGNALYQRLKTFVNEPTPWKYAFQLDEPGGWMLAQMDRAYKHGIRLEDGRLAYEPIKNKAGKIVGFTDNTKYGDEGRYVYNKQYLDKGAKLIDDHVDFENTKKFVDIAKHGKMKPNKVITDLLVKGGIEVDGRLTLSHLLNHMSGIVGPKKTWNALNIHHTQKVGVRTTGDYQILTNVLNKRAETIAAQIKNKNFTNVPELKESGIRIVVDGKAYGASKESAKAGLARVEKMAEGAVKKWGPKEFNKFRKFIKDNPKLARQAGMRLNSGIPIDEIMKMPGMKKAMPWIKGEGYFALADMLNNWTKGQSFWKGAGKGVEMATFGLVDFDTDENALIYHAREKGVPENKIKAMVDYLRYKKEEKKLTGLDTQLAYLDYSKDIGGELTPSHIMNLEEGYKYGDRERLTKRIAESEQNLEKLFEEYYAGENKDPTIGLVTLENMMESLTAEEWNKTAGIKGMDRGYREMVGAKADEGMVWGPIFGSSMREFFESIGGEETDSLKKFQPQELMMEHPVHGYKEQIRRMEEGGEDMFGVKRAPSSPMEDIRGHFGYALGDGGRVPFGKGQLVDKGRRAFMKWLASITGAGIAAGTGILKWGKGAKTVAPKVTEEVIKRGADGMPTYIDNLISVVQSKGVKNIVDSNINKFPDTVHSYKGVDVTQDAAGNIKIKSHKSGVATDPYTGKTHEGISQENHIQIERGKMQVKDEGLETQKSFQEPDEYIEGTVYPDRDGKMKDFVDGLDEAIHQDFKKIADEADEIIIKKASGGSVDYDNYLPDIEDIE